MGYTTLEKVKIRLKQFHVEEVTVGEEITDTVVFDNKDDNPLIEQLIEQATSDVKDARKYPADYDEDMIAEDIENYENTIIDLVVYDHSQAGEEYMSSYSENGISRTWVDRDKTLSSVCAIAKLI